MNTPEKSDSPLPLSPVEPGDSERILSLLPHKPPMLLLQKVVAISPEEGLCHGFFPAGFPLAEAEGVPAPLGIELIAQCAAAWKIAQNPRDPRGLEGRLLSARDVSVEQRRLPLEEILLVSGRPEGSALGFLTFAGEIHSREGRRLLSARIGILTSGVPENSQ